MAGPHPPNPTVGDDGRASPEPEPNPEQPEYIATEPAFATNPPNGAAQPSLAYPEQLPPTVAYPRRRRKRLMIGLLVVLALVGAMTAAIVYGVRTNGANTGNAFTEATAKTAIQGYLDALTHREVETVARNALCGMYDGVHDHRSDQALAKATSEAFRKEFSQIEVTSVDKIVYLSQYQAQVLFTMRATSGARSQVRGEIQGVAQLLFQRGQIFVCSYIPRDAGPY